MSVAGNIIQSDSFDSSEFGGGGVVIPIEAQPTSSSGGWLKKFVNTIVDVAKATIIQPFVSVANSVGANVSQPGYTSNVGNFLGDIPKSAVQPLSSTINAFGANTSPGEYQTEAGKFFGDLGKVGAEPIKNSFGSVVGHDNDFEYETKLGQKIGAGLELGIDTGHIALKTFADTVSGGYASKASDLLFRADEYEQSKIGYSEMSEQRFEKDSLLGTVEETLVTLAPVVGSIGAALATSGGGEEKKSVVEPIKETGMGTNASTWIQAAGSVVGSAVTALINQGSNANKPAAQAAAFNNPIVSNIADPKNFAAATTAAFGGPLPGQAPPPAAKKSWYDDNKVWLVPAGIIVTISLFLYMIYSIFKRKR